VANFLLLPAHKNLALNGSASATVDTDYDANWLVDGRPGRPARGTGGSFSATITNASSGNVNFVALVNHNLTSSVTVGGGVSGTITAPTTQQNGIPLNGFVSITLAAGVSSFTLSGSTSAAAWVVGGAYAGEATSLILPIYTSDEIDEDDLPRPIEMDLASIPPYDPGLHRRTWSGTWPALTTAERDSLIGALHAQRARTRPTVVARTTDTNDAMCGFITQLSHRPSEAPLRHEVSMTFEEIPRVRWP
jgi:hypothetical protein